MVIFSLVLAWLVGRYLPQLDTFRTSQGVQSYLQKSSVWAANIPGQSGVLQVVMVLVVPLLAVMVIFILLQGFLFGLPTWLLATSLLWYCMGPHGVLDSEVPPQADESHAILEGELETARLTLLETALLRLFNTVFWFLLLGPMGALLSRLSSELLETEGAKSWQEVIIRLQAILAWAPSRLLVFCFALVSSFDHVVVAWRDWQKDNPDAFDEPVPLLVKTSMAAYQQAASHDVSENILRYTQQLLKRAWVTWLVVVAVLTISGGLN